MFFLHGKSPNKEALLRTFKTLAPGTGKQYVFIASPALVTGVSQDTGVFTEVLEVISSYSTSAPDSEQRVVRPRYKPLLMTSPPRITTILVDQSVAMANVPGFLIQQFDDEAIRDPALRAYIEARTLSGVNSLEKAQVCLSNALFLKRWGAPYHIDVGTQRDVKLDWDAYFVRTVRASYMLKLVPPGKRTTFEEVRDAFTMTRRVKSVSEHKRFRAMLDGRQHSTTFMDTYEEARSTHSRSFALEHFLFAPYLDQANRKFTLMEDIKNLHAAAGRVMSTAVVQTDPEDEAQALIISTCASISASLKAVDYKHKAEYALKRFFALGAPDEHGPRFESGDAQWNAMVTLFKRVEDESRKRPRQEEDGGGTSAATAPPGNDEAANQAEIGADDDDDGGGADEEEVAFVLTDEKRDEWDQDLWKQRLAFGEDAVKDVATRVAKFYDSGGVLDQAEPDPVVMWTAMHEYDVQDAVRAIAVAHLKPKTIDELLETKTFSAFRERQPVQFKVEMLSDMLSALGFVALWGSSSTLPGIEDNPPRGSPEYTRKERVLKVFNVYNGSAYDCAAPNVLKAVMRFIERLKLGVKVGSANKRMYRVALAPHLRLYLGHAIANEGRVTEEHKTFWTDVKALEVPAADDGGAEVECEAA